MKFTQLITITGISLFLCACESEDNRLTIINSESFPENQITLDGSLSQHLLTDSVFSDSGETIQEQNVLTERIDQMNSMAEELRKFPSDSIWLALFANWEEFRVNHIDASGLPVVQSKSATDSLANKESMRATRKWAELNINLLKLSGEIWFGDALEKLLYEPKLPVLSEKLLKSMIYTHIDDQIFINVIGSSAVNHHHTTGGNIRLIQKTDFPAVNELTIKCECNDVRYLDVFIRIPEWAVNPTVTHGNVKYVSHPGEYCQISRKWNDGDEIQVRLMN
ncbi:MAG TPA: hypothetical protein VFC65_19965 [Prolixibacteraceae bacterium]|nr:hypothetical protein [Prolixibacteraceae bacterium]